MKIRLFSVEEVNGNFLNYHSTNTTIFCSIYLNWMFAYTRTLCISMKVFDYSFYEKVYLTNELNDLNSILRRGEFPVRCKSECTKRVEY